MFKNNLVRTGLLFVLLAAGLNWCFAQMYWTNSYNGYPNPVTMQPTIDGNYITAGFTQNSVGSPTGWFAKLNPNGDTLWTKTFGDSTYSKFLAMESVDGKFFLLIGFCSSSVLLGNGWVIKININGDVIWTRTYEKHGLFAYFHSIQKCTDGNFLIAGLTSTDRINYSGSLLVKITDDGDTLWTKSISEILYSIQSSTYENYLVAGRRKNSVSKVDEIYLMKLNNAGKIIWDRVYESSMGQEARKIYSANDGNYLLLGKSHTAGLLVKITPEGDTIWTKTYSAGFTHGFTDIISTKDGGFLITGYRNSDFNQWHVRINVMGDTLWTNTIYKRGYSKIFPAGNGIFLALGITSNTWFVSWILEDQYANKGSLFSFKIPTRGLDSLNCGYKPLKIPSGMTVSSGGTISWTPQTDSFYLENAKFVVADDQGRKDTLSLNIFVNINNKSSHIRAKHQLPQDKEPDAFTVASSFQQGKVQFIFPAPVEFLSIYNMSGRLIDRINPGSFNGRQTILWPAGKNGFQSGQYIASAVVGKTTQAKVFMLAR